MSGFDNSLDIDEPFKERYNYEDEFGWEDNGPPEGNNSSRNFNNSFKNFQYSEAYGAYRGGYGRDGGYAPPRIRPYLPRGAPPQAPLGFGPIRPMPRPRGPSMHRAAQFLAQCEVAPHYIRMLPREILNMIEPKYCGLCALNLDSFTVAKVHYNGRNHYKVQKKYTAQLYGQGTNQTYDVPMKARNLYCELCDVHITSKAHADSHYAGKSHRSVVEGRKPPKNPFLNQPGMEARVDHLIRRELKNPPKKLGAAEIKELMAAPLDKNIPPELTCNICNATVTSTEQMTNHLNGKKHLSKEKQFILKTMKLNSNGKVAECENGEAAGQQECEKGAAADQQECEKDAAADQQDAEQTAAAAENWGNGDSDDGGDDWDANN